MRFCRSIEQSSHSLLGVFLAGEGVENARSQNTDEALTHIKAPIYACISSSQKHGLAGESGEASKALSPKVHLGGMTQLAIWQHDADKVVTFGDKG